MPRLIQPGADPVFRGTRMVPAVLVLAYLLAGYLLFLFGPYEWPVREWWAIYLYVPLVYIALIWGFFLASTRNVATDDREMPHGYVVFGALAAIALLVPTAVTYTGKLPWEIGEALADQRAAYSALGEQLAITEGGRGPIAALRALVSPFTFCVLPLTIIYWRKLRFWLRALAIAAILTSVNLSILRGTTRELADLVIIGGSAFLIALARASMLSNRNLFAAVRERWKVLLAMPLLVLIVLTVLIGRTEARLGGQSIICIADSGVCVTQREPYASMDDATVFGMATVAGYLSQGYYGVALAAEKPFTSTYGLGHSPALSALYVLGGGNPQMLDRAYTARARSEGWSDATQWSSFMTWIANDIGLAGALIVVLLLGLWWGRTWVVAIAGRNDDAAILFCVLMVAIFYLPANNQIMSTYDGYITLLFWGFRAFAKHRKLVRAAR